MSRSVHTYLYIPYVYIHTNIHIYIHTPDYVQYVRLDGRRKENGERVKVVEEFRLQIARATSDCESSQLALLPSIEVHRSSRLVLQAHHP